MDEPRPPVDPRPRPPRTLLALIEDRDHVCYRYRLGAFAAPLAAAGWNLRPLVLRRGLLPTWTELGQIASADAVILQRWLFPWWRLALMRRAARRLLFDMDDAIFYRDSNRRRGPQSSRRGRRFRAIVAAADAVLAGNDFLVQQAVAIAGPAKVHYCPTCIDTRLYSPAAPRPQDRPLTLAWIGSRSTSWSLLDARRGLESASACLPGLTLRLICDAFPDLGPSIAIEHRPWSQASEAADLAEADVGISWLPDHPWSLGKCGLKVLQYMAAGLPVVANPIGVHCRMIEHGRNGMLAETPDQWAEAIRRLAASAEMRREMGRAARESVAKHYSVAAWSGFLPSLLDRLTGSLPPAIHAASPCRPAPVIPERLPASAR